MDRAVSALLATLLLASGVASATPPPDHRQLLLQDPMRFLEHAQVITLVHVVESKPGATPEHTSATLQVIKSWKGPYSAGRILHVEEPTIVSCHADDCEFYVFQPADKALLIVGFDARDRDPIAAWQSWTWPAAESQALMDALDQAVIRCPSCAKPPTTSR